MDSELRQVNTESHPVNRLHRLAYRFYHRNDIPTPRQMGENPRIMQALPTSESGICTEMEPTIRPPDLLPGYNPHGPSMVETSPIPVELSLDQQKQFVDYNPCITGLQTGNTVVDNTRTCHERSSMDIPRTSLHPIHRQFEHRMGWYNEQPKHFRQVGPRNDQPTYKSQRIESHLGDNETLQRPDNQSINPNCHRQHNNSMLSEQIRRNSFTNTHATHSPNTHVVSEMEHSGQSQTYSRVLECHKRPIISQEPDNQYRVVNPSISHCSNQSNMGETTSRLVCDPVQLQATPLLLPSPGPKGTGSRQSITVMEEHSGICISTSSPNAESSEQSSNRPNHHLPDSTSMELQELVSNPAKSSSRPPKVHKTNKKPIKTAIKQHVPRVSSHTQLTRLESVRKHLTNKGFSKRTAYCISQRCRKATNNLYEARWKIFTHWCNKRKINPFNVTTPQLADFLDHLATDLKKGLSAIQGYRAVINTTIQLCKNREPGNNIYINSLIRSYKQKIPVQDHQIPKWNLNLVLNSLTKPPYEPMLSASLKHVSWKTAFLTAFATAARVGELAALDSKKIAHTETWSEIVVQTHPSFVAKNQDLAVDNKPRKFTIPALFDFAGPDLPDRLLCPVRSIRYYLQKAKKLRDKHKRALFISFDPQHKGEITANTLGNWIKNVIRHAYNTADDTDCDLGRISAHEVRALSASVQFQKNLSLQSLNQACYWRGHSTFTTYYLRDITLHRDGEMCLPNVVAASKKITN